MVMMTRSRSRACESYSSSENSNQKGIPPWCSSAKLYNNKRRQSWEAKSSCDLRENIWQYLHRNEETTIKRTRKHKRSRSGMKVATLTTYAIVCLAIIAIIWITNNEKSNTLITKLIPYTKFITKAIGKVSSPVTEECCHRMKYLSAALFRAEQALRNTQRMRRTMILASHPYLEKSAENVKQNLVFISEAIVTKGSDTEEWGGKVALWGIVPLWRAAPPPDTVLNMRKPMPADCWPFSGSVGQLNFELAQKHVIHSISIEHVKPDTARSSPKNFALYGLLENGTWIKALEAEYRFQGPAKQYFPLKEKEVQLKKLFFKVLSNHGNVKYTCLYRVYMYQSLDNKVVF